MYTYHEEVMNTPYNITQHSKWCIEIPNNQIIKDAINHINNVINKHGLLIPTKKWIPIWTINDTTLIVALGHWDNNIFEIASDIGVVHDLSNLADVCIHLKEQFNKLQCIKQAVVH